MLSTLSSERKILRFNNIIEREKTFCMIFFSANIFMCWKVSTHALESIYRVRVLQNHWMTFEQRLWVLHPITNSVYHLWCNFIGFDYQSVALLTSSSKWFPFLMVCVSTFSDMAFFLNLSNYAIFLFFFYLFLESFWSF